MKTFRVPLLHLLVLAACGGNSDSCSSPGELGRVRFSYVSGNECQFGCNLEAPMMLGTKERLRVMAEQPVDSMRVQSTNPAVAAVTTSSAASTCELPDGRMEGRVDCGTVESGCRADCEGRGGKYKLTVNFSAEALGVGETVFEVIDQGGALFDKIPVEVREPRAVELSVATERAGQEELETVELANGAAYTLNRGERSGCHARVLDDDGDPLRASVATVISESPELVRFDAERGTNGGLLVPLAPGTASIRVEAAGIISRVNVRVP